MKLSPRALAGLAVLAAGFGAWRLFRSEPAMSPEAVIRRQVADMAHAAEQKDLSFIMERISPKFASREGATRDEVKSILAGQLFRGQFMSVWVADVAVALESPTRAEMKGKFLLGRSNAKTLQQLAAQSEVQAYEIDGTLALEEGQWRFISETHRPIDASQFL